METAIATIVGILGVLLSAGNDAAIGLTFSFEENDLFASPKNRTERDADQDDTPSPEYERDRPFSKKLPLLPVPDSSSMP